MKRTTLESTLESRGSTHGDPVDQATAAQELKCVIVKNTTNGLNSMSQECLDMIALKISRIITGDFQFADHWHDIAGYATLAQKAIPLPDGVAAHVPEIDLELNEWIEVNSIQAEVANLADELFPNRTVEIVLAKLILEEMPEYLLSKRAATGERDSMELADCGILLYDIAHLTNVDLDAAMKEKLTINRNREWTVCGTTGLMHHVKAEEHEPTSRTERYGKPCLAIPLTPEEIQSGNDRLRIAERLIAQLPSDHDERNAWLMKYGERNDT